MLKPLSARKHRGFTLFDAKNMQVKCKKVAIVLQGLTKYNDRVVRIR